MGSIGAVRSNAWICDFSSTHRSCATWPTRPAATWMPCPRAWSWLERPVQHCWLVDGAGGSCGVCCNSSNDKIYHGPGQLAVVLVCLAVRFPIPDIDGVEAAQ